MPYFVLETLRSRWHCHVLKYSWIRRQQSTGEVKSTLSFQKWKGFNSKGKMVTSKDASTLRVPSSGSCKQGWSARCSQGREMPFLSAGVGRWEGAGGGRCSQGRERGEETRWSEPPPPPPPPRQPTWESKLYLCCIYPIFMGVETKGDLPALWLCLSWRGCLRKLWGRGGPVCIPVSYICIDTRPEPEIFFNTRSVPD